jgi:YHS domain-containing protein
MTSLLPTIAVAVSSLGIFGPVIVRSPEINSGLQPTGANSTAVVGSSDESAAEAASGQWIESLAAAQDMARERRLPVLLHFEAEWCGACRQMESAVLSQPEVLARLGTAVVGVRIDADQAPELISQYGIASLPTDIVLDADGQELQRFTGGTSLSEYSRRLSSLANRSGMPGTGSSATGSTGSEIADSDGEEELDPELRSCLIVRHGGKIVGLGGYSPVSMQRDKEWVRGSEEFVGTYQGVDYFFESAEHRELFFSSPAQFIPRLHGLDPVEIQRRGRATVGAIELGAIYKGQLYFFRNRANLRRFQNNPAWYVEALETDELNQLERSPGLQGVRLN